MKIAIDIRGIIGKKTGKGIYTENILMELLEIDKKNKYILYSNHPIHLGEDVEVKVIKKKGILWHFSALKSLYKEKPDIFFSPTSYIIPAIHNPKKLNVVMTVHDLVALLFISFHNKKAVFIENSCLRKAAKKVKKIVAVSENTKKDLIKKLKIKENKIDIVFNAVNNTFRSLPKEEKSKFEDIPKKYILSVGTLEPRKNYVFLLNVFKKILKNSPDIKLVIIGQEGWKFEEIFKQVHNLSIQNSVIFMGYVGQEKLVSYYNNALVLVYPSKYEGFGIPPLEAMKCGCPVVVSDNSSLPEVVGDAGILCKTNDEDEFVEKIEDLLGNEDKREYFSAKGLRKSEEFSWKKSAEKLLSIFENIA
jgi:glycosyltransferase involved in cell wall biosynthesis